MDDLKELYYNVAEPGSYGGVEGLYRNARSAGTNVNRKQVRDFLSYQDTYTLHKDVRRKFKRNRTIVYGIDEQWQIDLVELQTISRFNRGYRYILCCIDVFSKYAFVVAVKDKKGETMVRAFDNILESGRKPKRVQSDHGNEFVCNAVQSHLRGLGIHFFATHSEPKAAVVERFNRTLKERMFRYFTENNTHNYIDVLKDIVHAYNNSYHRSIKRKPIEVTVENSGEVWKNLYGDVDFSPPISYPFEIGDLVRISKNKRTFEKGYLPNWTEELFRVVSRLPRDPPVYKLNDLNSEPISGIFYKEEIQRVGKDLDNCIFKIDKVLKKRRKPNGIVEKLVRWKGYPSSFDSWVREIIVT